MFKPSANHKETIAKNGQCLSNSKETFEEHFHPYQEALKTAGYTEKLEYRENKTAKKKLD